MWASAMSTHSTNAQKLIYLPAKSARVPGGVGVAHRGGGLVLVGLPGQVLWVWLIGRGPLLIVLPGDAGLLRHGSIS